MTRSEHIPRIQEAQASAYHLLRELVGAGAVNEVAHAAGRGAVAAMAMTGMRAFTVNLGIVEQPPPQAIFKQKARGPDGRGAAQEAPRGDRARSTGATAPVGARRSRCSRMSCGGAVGGPVYGLVIWLGFELGIAPALGLSQAKKLRPGRPRRDSPRTTCCTASSSTRCASAHRRAPR